jgi:hypothetical protein
MNRKVIEDFRFSDGTLLPKDSWVAVSNLAMHLDKVRDVPKKTKTKKCLSICQDYYQNPETFDGFRFAKMAEQDVKEGGYSKHGVSTLSTEYILFGHGRHAW